MRRTLFAKIFGWFLLTMVFGALSVMAVSLLTGNQPIGNRWMRVTQDLYARSAVDFYKTGGVASLKTYLETLRHSSGIEGQLLRTDESDVMGDALLPNVRMVLHRSEWTGASTFRLGRTWSAASPVSYGTERFYFVAEVDPLSGFLNGTFMAPTLLRVLLALTVAGLLCLLLARHIVAPIRALQDAAQRIAAGDWSTRVLPAMAPRNDELADTARAFDQMAEQIQSLLQKRQGLLADISHELRSPLTRLSVSLELLRRGETDVQEQMQSDVDRMNTMIGQILLLTRLDAEIAKPEFRRVALVSMIESVVADAEFEGKQLEKAVQLQVAEPCFVEGDANLLRSGLENIIRNALHYTQAFTAVEISVRLLDTLARPRCEIVVDDHGPGVSQEALPFLFDPFYRASESRNQKDGGAGLGLSISQKVVALHGGTILATNREDGVGLRVTVILPAVL